MKERCHQQITVEIPQSFSDFVEGALLRIQARYPDLRFRVTDAGLEVNGVPVAEVDQLRKQVFHAVYREKIYIETLPLRHKLIEAVTTR
ncbi:MAG: hypothetical protein EKK31_02210 [Hyphomicrobiales bacterium]|nr:MAG: hypothetical protein EKK31_02210 [Hyphomicrobiales bacterium]